jgi:hypothetical protein
MATNAKRANATAVAAVTAMGVLLNTGYLRIYDGTQPATADTAISGQTMLAELRFSATAFASYTNGVATANAITSATAAATGTATWFRALSSNGTTVVYDGNVSTAGADLNLNTTSIVSGATVAVTALTLTEALNA